jgi:hypothetical protein
MYFYQLEGEPGAEKILDGKQRTDATKAIDENPDRFGWRAGNYREAIKRVPVHVIKQIYPNGKSAMQAFQNINSGTTMTAKQYFAGILTECILPSLYNHWKDSLGQFIGLIERAGREFVQVNTGTQTLNKQERFIYAILWTLWDGNGFPENGRLPFQNLTSKSSKDKYPVEERLVSIINQWGVSEFNHNFDKATKYVQEEIAFIRDCWRDAKNNTGLQSQTAMQGAAYLNLILFGEWRRRNNIPVKRWQGVVTDFLSKGQGKSRIVIKKDGLPDAEVTFNYGGHHGLYPVLRQLNASDLIPGEGRKRKRHESIIHGNDVDHVRPFSLFGEGKTQIISSSLNRSKKDDIVSEATNG